MSGISRLKNKIYETLGLDEWGNRDVIPNSLDSEIIETNQEFQNASINGAKIIADSITTRQLNFVPATSSNVIATINASTEGITIDADNINISGATTFSSGYDPTTKVDELAGSYASAASGARVLIFPDANTGIQVIDNGGADVFKAIVGGTNVGDVILGDFSSNKYVMWDKSTTTLTLGSAAYVDDRLASTLADAINSSGNLVTDVINTKINTSAKNILSDFNFGTTDYAGAVKAGDITWNTTTGAITGGSGIVVYRGGIVGAKAGVATFSIDASTGDATFAGALSAATGTFVGSVSIGSGNNIFKADSNGIYLGNATFASAPFRVDMAGNAKVSSLARDDYHWFTIFESVDGYSKTFGGAGTITATSDGALLTTGASNGNYCNFKRNIGNQITFDNNQKFKTSIRINSVTNSYQKIFLVVGIANDSGVADKHYGFQIIGDALYATTANGTSYEDVDLSTTLSAGNEYILEAVLDAVNSNVKFYLDGSLLATLDTYIPTGNPAYAFYSYIQTTQDAVKEINIKWLDFWQAN